MNAPTNDYEVLEMIMETVQEQKSAALSLYRRLKDAQQEIEAWKAATGYETAEEFVKKTYGNTE